MAVELLLVCIRPSSHIRDLLCICSSFVRTKAKWFCSNYVQELTTEMLIQVQLLNCQITDTVAELVLASVCCM